MTPRFVADILRSAWLWHLACMLIHFMSPYAALGFVTDLRGTQAVRRLTALQKAILDSVQANADFGRSPIQQGRS
jgi:hypothetical protein